MFVDRGLVVGEINAEGLVGGDVGMFPLDLGSQFREGGVERAGGILQLAGVHGADLGDVAFDYIALQHGVSFFVTGGLILLLCAKT